MYQLVFSEEILKTLKKLKKTNKKQYDIIKLKSEEIIKDPHGYKNLRAPKNHLKRVHIDNHFVLVFSINEEEKTVILEDYNHHNFIYK